MQKNRIIPVRLADLIDESEQLEQHDAPIIEGRSDDDDAQAFFSLSLDLNGR